MITKAVERAYAVLKERNWDTVYWAIDLHGVCFPSTYTNGNYTFINDMVLPALKKIRHRPESRIILWSSCHKNEQSSIMEFFEKNGVSVDYFNENPEVPDTPSGSFTEKFYFSILLDDKAGFDPAVDWLEIMRTLENI